MNKDEIKIIKNTIINLNKKNWDSLKLTDVLDKNNKFQKNIKNKNDLFKHFNKYIDYLLKNNSSTVEKSTSKDMLFEVIMLRFDILEEMKIPIIKIFTYYKFKPNKLILFLPSFLDSILLIASLANININGIKGYLKIKGIFLIYIATFLVWVEDNTDGLEKTMNKLNKYIDSANEIFKKIK